MTDIELPDFNRQSQQSFDLCDTDRSGVMLQRARLLVDGQDSGTNSMSTTGSGKKTVKMGKVRQYFNKYFTFQLLLLPRPRLTPRTRLRRS